MVFVMAAGDGLLMERLELVQELREVGIKVRVGSLVLLTPLLPSPSPCAVPILQRLMD